VPADAIVIAENGAVVELSQKGARIVGQVEAGVTFVDGLGVGDVQDVALRDRRRLSEDGVLIIVATLSGTSGGVTAPPELIARGFGDDEELLDELREEAANVLADLVGSDIVEIKLIQEHLHDAVGQVIYGKTRRRPMILPVVIEICPLAPLADAACGRRSRPPAPSRAAGLQDAARAPLGRTRCTVRRVARASSFASDAPGTRGCAGLESSV